MTPTARRPLRRRLDRRRGLPARRSPTPASIPAGRVALVLGGGRRGPRGRATRSASRRARVDGRGAPARGRARGCRRSASGDGGRRGLTADAAAAAADIVVNATPIGMAGDTRPARFAADALRAGAGGRRPRVRPARDAVAARGRARAAPRRVAASGCSCTRPRSRSSGGPAARPRSTRCAPRSAEAPLPAAPTALDCGASSGSCARRCSSWKRSRRRPGGVDAPGNVRNAVAARGARAAGAARKTGALWLDAGPIAGRRAPRRRPLLAATEARPHGPVDDGSDAPHPPGRRVLRGHAPATRLVPVRGRRTRAVVVRRSGRARATRSSRSTACSKQWREILRVIPSLECRPRLLDAARGRELVLDRERWALLVALDGRRTVRELVQRTERPVIDVCHALLELIEAGAVGVVDPAAARADAESSTRPRSPRWPRSRRGVAPADPSARAGARRAGPDRAGRVGPTAEPVRALAARRRTRRRRRSCPTATPSPREPEPDAEPEAAGRGDPATEAPVPRRRGRHAAEPPDRRPRHGAFLRLFSGLRDS